jgi:Holliday junction resolvasome RuvABC endonuclease subunit
MGKTIKVAGIDPALRNMGIAVGHVDLETLELVRVEKLVLAKTEGDKDGKQIRKNSDDLRRARVLTQAMREHTHDAVMVFAEVPVGSQSARAMASYGLCVGVLAGCDRPLLEVTPTEVKLAGAGVKTATKSEMIEWATEKHPEAQWLTVKRQGKQVFVDANEHLADAVAAIYAGIRTQEFKRAAAMMCV